MSSGKAIIFSAPSGSGKTTIVKHLIKNNSNLGFSISACTRDKRGRDEKNGKDYYFLTPEEFKNKIDQNAFYGTLKEEFQRIWDEGKHVIFDVDVKGGLNLKEYFGENGLAIFVKVPSLDVLKNRLKDRGTESEESLSRRLYKAQFEMTFENRFDVSLINDDIEKSCSDAEMLVNNFLEK